MREVLEEGLQFHYLSEGSLWRWLDSSSFASDDKEKVQAVRENE
jgi:hypothetical protein